MGLARWERLAVLAAWLAGCGGTAETADPPIAGSGGSSDAGFEATVQPLLNVACNCHQSDPLLAPFSLRPGDAYANLVGRPASELPSMLLVSPGRLNDSYLWHKVNDTQAQVGGSGTIMPPTIPLSADERSVLELWIARGAMP